LLSRTYQGLPDLVDTEHLMEFEQSRRWAEGLAKGGEASAAAAP